MPLPLQTRLLRVVQERQIRPVGGTELVAVDTRIVAATRRDLAAMVAEGTFRNDLYYRLRGFAIELPPLRERGDDVEHLVEWWFARAGGTRGNGERPPVSKGALGLLRAHRWPGNVRELLATLEYASIRSGGDRVGVEHLPAELRTVVARHDPGAYGDALCEGRADGAEAILAALHETGGNRRLAARRLGISRTTLWRRMKRLDLKAPESALPSS